MKIIGPAQAMRDAVAETQVSDTYTEHLSHDMPCQARGPAPHTFLARGDSCECQPVTMPGLAA